MTDHAFSNAQAHYDAAEPGDDEVAPPFPVGAMLESLLEALELNDQISDDTSDVHPLSDRQATAAIWIDGHQYSLTLNREDA